MTTESDLPKQTVRFYGKKTYLINELIAKKVKPLEKEEPKYFFEDIEDDKGK